MLLILLDGYLKRAELKVHVGHVMAGFDAVRGVHSTEQVRNYIVQVLKVVREDQQDLDTIFAAGTCEASLVDYKEEDLI